MCRIWAGLLAVCTLMLAPSAQSQVVRPEQIGDPAIRELQEKYWKDLTALGEDLKAQQFPYHFYLSRKLDINEKRQRRIDQRSIQLGRFRGHLVLEITGNYYAAYSSEVMNREQRAGQSFQDVVLPILRVAVQHFQDNPDVDGYALEISHHIFGRVWGISIENAENLFLMLPQRAARRLIQATDEGELQTALSEAEVLLNGQPVSINLGVATPPRS
jgi:hypothetical protein